MTFHKNRQSRRLGIVLMVFMFPILSLFILATTTMGLNQTNRYLLPYLPTFAMAVGISMKEIFNFIHSASVEKQVSSSWTSSLLPISAPALTALSLMLIPPAEFNYDPQELRFSHVQTLSRKLKNYGWTYGQAMAGIKGPKDYLLMDALSFSLPTSPAGKIPLSNENLIVLKAPDTLQGNLPSGCQMLPSEYGNLLTIKNKSKLNWKSFEACWQEKLDKRDGKWNCEMTGLTPANSYSPEAPFIIKGLPKLPLKTETRLRFKIPLHDSQNNSQKFLLMPQMAGTCRGKITSISTSVPHVVKLEYDLGSPECPATTYYGFPPFFFELTMEQAKFVKLYFNVHGGVYPI